MTTLTDLCSDVYTITNRPDLINETKLAVKAATLKMHQSDYYYRDLLEQGITFDTLDYTQQFDIYSVFPNYRALKYIRRYDNSSTGAAKEFFEILTPTNILDAYGNDRTGVAYVAGTVVNIKSFYQFQYALIGIYINPDITDDNYSSWIADTSKYAIVFEAARVVFKQIGFDEQSTTFQALVAEQVAMLKVTNINPVGY